MAESGSSDYQDYVFDDESLDADIPLEGERYDPLPVGQTAHVDPSAGVGTAGGVDFDWRSVLKDAGYVVGEVADVVKNVNQPATPVTLPPKPPQPPVAPPSTTTPAQPPKPVTPTTPAAPGRSVAVPVAVGVGTLALVGVAVYAARKRRTRRRGDMP